MNSEARIQDATGRYFGFDLGPASGAELEPGWSFLVADLSKPNLASGGGPGSLTKRRSSFLCCSLPWPWRRGAIPNGNASGR